VHAKAKMVKPYIVLFAVIIWLMTERVCLSEYNANLTQRWKRDHEQNYFNTSAYNNFSNVFGKNIFTLVENGEFPATADFFFQIFLLFGKRLLILHFFLRTSKF